MNSLWILIGIISQWNSGGEARPAPNKNYEVINLPQQYLEEVIIKAPIGGSPTHFHGPGRNSTAGREAIQNYLITHFEDFVQEQKDEQVQKADGALATFGNLRIGREKRKAVAHKHFWPFGIIPYEISTTYDEVERHEIFMGMKAWEDGTCLRFAPYSRELARKLGHPDRLYFEKRQACTSFVGRRTKGRHLISACPQWTYTLVHELGHAIGMRHQHQTPDRDKYIDIHWENIAENVNLKQSFGIVGNPSYYDQALLRAVPYDVHSIMHYPFNAFSKHYSLPVITVKAEPNLLLDWRTKPSFNDLKLVNLMYGCADHCRVKIDCQNGGFQSPTDCRVCLCPATHWGTWCEHGGILKL